MNISLKKFNEEHIKLKVKWINDPDNNQFLHYDLPLDEIRTKQWYKANKGNNERRDYVIYFDNNPVGIIGLINIDHEVKKAEYYITIGERDFLGKGIAKKATEKLIYISFYEIGLNKLFLFTEVDNINAQKLFESVGFKKEGLLKDDVINSGKLVDRFAYGMTKKEVPYSREDAKTYPIFIQKISDFNNNNIHIMRDDLLPFSFGGNKLRKSEFFFEEIKKNKHKAIVTYGSSSSNHVRIIANKAAKLSLPLYVISPNDIDKENYNLSIMNMLNVDIIDCDVDNVKETISTVIEDLEIRGLDPYFIEGGGHGNLGTKAYLDVFFKILKEEKRLGIEFDYIFHASGTGTTQAGLVVGNLLSKTNKQIVGISIARKNPLGKDTVLKSVNDFLNVNYPNYSSPEIIFVDDYILGGYGKYNELIVDTIKRIFTNEGVPLDTTYTGKAYWGMEDYIIKNNIQNKKVLFIHTGGTPLFFNDILKKGDM